MRKKSILSMVKMTLVSVMSLLDNLYEAIDRELKDDTARKEK